jgi:hypothetical protein
MVTNDKFADDNIRKWSTSTSSVAMVCKGEDFFFFYFMYFF